MAEASGIAQSLGELTRRLTHEYTRDIVLERNALWRYLDAGCPPGDRREQYSNFILTARLAGELVAEIDAEVLWSLQQAPD